MLTPVPPAAPRINGPVVCGARPGKHFIYRLPTQGERPIRFEVKFVERGLADVGVQYLGIDGCWMRLTQEMYDHRRPAVVKQHAGYDYRATGTIGPIRDEDGNSLPSGEFPDMKARTEYIHGQGLKAGIYSSPGVKTCQDWSGSCGHECADADQYAQWAPIFSNLFWTRVIANVPANRRRVSDVRFRRLFARLLSHLQSQLVVADEGTTSG